MVRYVLAVSLNADVAPRRGAVCVIAAAKEMAMPIASSPCTSHGRWRPGQSQWTKMPLLGVQGATRLLFKTQFMTCTSFEVLIPATHCEGRSPESLPAAGDKKIRGGPWNTSW